MHIHVLLVVSAQVLDVGVKRCDRVQCNAVDPAIVFSNVGRQKGYPARLSLQIPLDLLVPRCATEDRNHPVETDIDVSFGKLLLRIFDPKLIIRIGHFPNPVENPSQYDRRGVPPR